MQKFYSLLALLSTCVILISSCEEKLADNDWDNASDYYPSEVGRYIIYDVDSVIYSETDEPDTNHWQIKEEVVDTFYDLEGLLNYRIERSRRLNESFDWLLQEVWSIREKNGSIERDEDNLRFIKLVSPVSPGKEWDGTVYLGDLDSLPVEVGCNNLSFLEDWDYNYEFVYTSANVNDHYFDSTLTVFQQGADNLLELNYATEVYAKGVGIVKKEFYHYTSQNTSNIPWEEKVECGYKYMMTMIEYH